MRKIIIAIFLLAVFLRFYNFPARWGFGPDDSRDIAISRVALVRHDIPLVGSFSSAGPFVFGPLFYWFIMASYIVLPYIFESPYIFTCIFMIGAAMTLGYATHLLLGKRAGVIAFLLATISPQLVSRSLAMTQHSFVGVFASFAFLFFVLLWIKKKTVFALLMGMCVGVAISMHYQALNLLIFFPAILLVPKFKWCWFLSAGLGLLLPSLPLLLWDSRQNFANTNNILDYFILGQKRLYVPNSWKLFLLNQFPSYWGYVTGGNKITGVFLLFSSLIFLLIQIVRKPRHLLSATGIIFVLLLIANRFYKGERFEGYLLYFVPFIIICSTLIIEKLFSWKKYLGVILTIIIVLGSLIKINEQIAISNNQVANLYKITSQLKTAFPNNKFAIFDDNLQTTGISQPLSAIMGYQNLTAFDGIKIGTCKYCPLNSQKIAQISSINLIVLEDNSKNWYYINEERMFEDMIGWSEKNELKSTFSLPKYIQYLVTKQ